MNIRNINTGFCIIRSQNAIRPHDGKFLQYAFRILKMKNDDDDDDDGGDGDDNYDNDDII